MKNCSKNIHFIVAEEISMKASKILGLCNINYNCEIDFEVSNIIYDSREAIENCIFVCIDGANTDGHSYAISAAERGAKLIIAEKEIESKIPYIIVKDTKKALALLSAHYFNKPFEKIKTIGITGTKGKTTTSILIKSILESSGYKVGVIGTIGLLIGDEIIRLENTTPQSYLVQKYMAKLVDEGCDFCVMEVSSLGIRDKRVYGFNFDCGVFTNFSEDHIGGVEHKDMDEYLQCKSELFRMCKNGVLNFDDENINEILSGHTCQVTSFGFSDNADYRCTESKLTSDSSILGSTLKVTGKIKLDLKINLPGKFNSYNALAALATCINFGVDEDSIVKGLTTAKAKGRVEPVNISDNFTLLLDYAHNAISLQSVLSTIRDYNPKRIVCLFGAGGNRPKVRRYEMGEVSGRLADLSIITADNNRYESVFDILDDIKLGMSKTEGRYIEIPNRRDAIKYSIQNAQEGDVILLAGKGHEDYQEINGEKLPFDERIVIKEILSELNQK